MPDTQEAVKMLYGLDEEEQLAVCRVIAALYADEYGDERDYTAEELADIREGLEDFKAGKVLTQAQLRQSLGLHN